MLRFCLKTTSISHGDLSKKSHIICARESSTHQCGIVCRINYKIRHTMLHSPGWIYILPGVFVFYAIFILAFHKKCKKSNCVVVFISLLLKFSQSFSPKVFYFSFSRRGSAGKEIRNIPFPICGRKGGEKLWSSLPVIRHNP